MKREKPFAYYRDFFINNGYYLLPSVLQQKNKFQRYRQDVAKVPFSFNQQLITQIQLFQFNENAYISQIV